jgi:hypothetical protein
VTSEALVSVFIYQCSAYPSVWFLILETETWLAGPQLRGTGYLEEKVFKWDFEMAIEY